MKWNRILRRLENKLTINKEDCRIIVMKLKITNRNSFEFQRLLMVKRRYEIQAKSLQDAVRYVKHNRSTYPLRRIERKFHINMRGR